MQHQLLKIVSLNQRRVDNQPSLICPPTAHRYSFLQSNNFVQSSSYDVYIVYDSKKTNVNTSLWSRKKVNRAFLYLQMPTGKMIKTYQMFSLPLAFVIKSRHNVNKRLLNTEKDAVISRKGRKLRFLTSVIYPRVQLFTSRWPEMCHSITYM